MVDWLVGCPPTWAPPPPETPLTGAVQFDVGWYAMEGCVQVDTVLGVAFQDPQTALQQLEVPLHTQTHIVHNNSPSISGWENIHSFCYFKSKSDFSVRTIKKKTRLPSGAQLQKLCATGQP